ncbi:MAG: ABC transporter permease [Fibrobacteraceae bacterium]|nr:ABC transporter permease [Fibrobacteraceae bacterium]
MYKKSSPLVIILSYVGIALLYIPLLFIALFSVNANRHGQTWGGFSFDWYIKLFSNELVGQATLNSIILAVVSTIIATLFGTLLAIGIHRTPWNKKIRSFFDYSINIPVVTPDILMAIALVTVFGLFRTFLSCFEPGMLTLIISHVVFQLSFVVLVVLSRLASIPKDQIEAARDLYASTSGAWFRVILPQLFTGIIAGALLAFTLSLDDFIISFFVSGPTSQTLPLYIYGSLKRGVSPEIHALSTLIISLTLIVMLLVLFNNQKKSKGKDK